MLDCTLMFMLFLYDLASKNILIGNVNLDMIVTLMELSGSREKASSFLFKELLSCC